VRAYQEHLSHIADVSSILLLAHVYTQVIFLVGMYSLLAIRHCLQAWLSNFSVHPPALPFGVVQLILFVNLTAGLGGLAANLCSSYYYLFDLCGPFHRWLASLWEAKLSQASRRSTCTCLQIPVKGWHIWIQPCKRVATYDVMQHVCTEIHPLLLQNASVVTRICVYIRLVLILYSCQGTKDSIEECF